MKQYALILLSAALALAGCGDNAPGNTAPAPATEAGSDNPLSGVWVQDDQVLVLEDNGDFYLPNDALRQGLSWEQQDNRFTFRYLDSNALSVEQITANGQLQDRILTLSPLSDTPSAASSETAETDNEAPPMFVGTFEKDSSVVGFLSGHVVLPDNAELPAQPVLTVALLADNNITLRRVIRLNGADNRYPFRIYYPASEVENPQSWQVRSQILAGGGIYYQSDITDLTPAAQGFADITLPLDPVTSDRETLRGALVWQQAGPVFTLCNSDQRLQISGPQGQTMVNDIRDDAAYPLQPRIATVSGVRRKIPGQQEGTTQAAIAVESFSLASRDDWSDCQIPVADLENTRWVLSHLGEEPVTLPEDSAPLHLVLNDGEGRGNGGCNRFQARYQQEGEQLRFKPVTSTEMACPALETEQAFYQALGNSDHYRIDGELLTLFDEENSPVASFQAVYL